MEGGGGGLPPSVTCFLPGPSGVVSMVWQGLAYVMVQT